MLKVATKPQYYKILFNSSITSRACEDSIRRGGLGEIYDPHVPTVRAHSRLKLPNFLVPYERPITLSLDHVPS